MNHLSETPALLEGNFWSGVVSKYLMDQATTVLGYVANSLIFLHFKNDHNIYSIKVLEKEEYFFKLGLSFAEM
jgi:hypothetical protein